MPLERAADHPTYELGGNAITSFAAPSRGANEASLFRTQVPPGGGLPKHRHDHLDVFAIERGTATFHVDDETFELATGDSFVVPTGAWHFLEAGSDGVTITVAMLGGTKFIREDGSEMVPPWLG